jgi:signal transduction histidine kinase
MEHAKEVTMGARDGLPLEVNRKERALAKAELDLVKQTAAESGASQNTLDLIEKLNQAQTKTLSDLWGKDPKTMMDHLRAKDMKLDDLFAASKVIFRGTNVAEIGTALDESMDQDVAAKKQQQDEVRQRVKWTVLLLFLAIFAVAIALIAQFSSDVLKRLNILMVNAELVGNRSSILNQVRGTDELSYLNSILLEADSELKSVEEHRKSLMEMVAHDMRSPLMASQVSLEIVEKQSDSLPENFKQGLSMAQRNLERVLQFIEELLSIEKLEAGDIELSFGKFSVKEAVDDCIHSLSQLAANRNIKLINSCSAIEINADRRRIEQVLTNFVSNAIKFSKENSEIEISNDTIHDQVRIFVKDQGKGMSKATCRKVFDRYFQTSEGRQKQGYGLGLAICRLLIESHGGQVGAESDPGQGSTFWLRVPISQPEGATAIKTNSIDYLQHQVSIFKARDHWLDFVHPRILEKVLLCSLLPLLFEAGMLGWISYSMIETENLSDKARDHYVAMHCVNYTVSAISVGDMRLLRYFLTNRTKDRDLALHDFDKVGEKLAEFQSLKTHDQTSDNALKNCQSTLVLLKKLQDLAKNPKPERFDNLHELSTLMTEHNKEINFEEQERLTRRDIVANQAELLRLSKEELAKRTDVQTKIYLGIAANLLFATILIVVFSQSVTKRLNVLVDHARKLPKREPLEATVSGIDELAYLDTVLQHTSERLIESSEHRRAVMQMVAHDMRSPMMAAQASIELLNAVHGESLPAVGRRHLPSAEKNIDRILHLVNDLLTLDKLEAGKLELDIAPCDLHQLAEEAISTVGGLAAQAGMTLLNECESAVIEADAPRLNQVLSNLISNAIKFSSKGATIKVISRVTPKDVSIGVEDNGPGMDAKTAAQVFDKFFQSEGEKKSKGFGLGLAICKLIAESHGGSVAVDTALGRGSTFWISLPAVRRG